MTRRDNAESPDGPTRLAPASLQAARGALRLARHGARSFAVVVGHGMVGGVLGVLLLHPVTMAIYWFEFHTEHATAAAVFRFVAERLRLTFTGGMLPMTGAFLAIGGSLGIGSGVYARALRRHLRLAGRLDRELGRSVGSLIAAGESEQVEFKASVRWDFGERRVNKALEFAIARTMAAFMNHRGGTVLIGVEDTGAVVGLKNDYATLARPDRDGFERFVTGMVRTRLGGDLCASVHVLFHTVREEDVCRVVIEPSPRPVYLRDGQTMRYFLRTGNATSELDVREATEHIARRWPRR